MRSRVVAGMRGLFARHIETVACVTPACAAMVFIVTGRAMVEMLNGLNPTILTRRAKSNFTHNSAQRHNRNWGCTGAERTRPTAMLALFAATTLAGFSLAADERPRVVHLAEAALAAPPMTIVTARNPRSAGGPHDFSSEGDYWWPDPKNPDGPYLQRDGMTNPDNFVAHRQFLLSFTRNFGYLAGAYKITRDERFAAAAVKHLRAWFVDPATRMNPSLLYSQA